MTGILLAEFESGRAAADAAKAAARAGIPPQDLLSPVPMEGIDALLAPSDGSRPIGWIMVFAGLVGAAIGYGMQWYSAVIDYPILSGGRPLNSWPAFLLVPYETAILAASVVGILAWLWLCGLPMLFHPLFAAPAVERATQDRYLLVFTATEDLAARIAAELEPRAVYEIGE